ncbi:hypothetical protein [Paraburkholderia sp. J8-2]|uniref:hypothetical protein n=1 Tax=Paraburkholderia sp. J8-2 TaxID=2805440 RepID=UPI002AB6EFE0|nr:hypothetical protein [Paraburkholderia sp. J8-2]
MNNTTPILFAPIFTCVVLAFAWMVAQKIQHATVQYAIGVIRKVLIVFLIAPALVFFLWLGADCGFSGKAAASGWYLSMHPELVNKNLKLPTVKDSRGQIIVSEPKDADELIERIGGGITMTYLLGVFAGVAYVFLQWMILGEGKPAIVAKAGNGEQNT